MIEKFFKSQIPQIQADALGGESRHFSPKFVFLILLILLLLITILGGVYYFYPRAKVPPRKIPEAPPETKKTSFKDVFNWPGWSKWGVEVFNNGSGLRFFGEPETRWFLLQNENSASWLTVNGDFEIQLRVSLGEKTGGDNPTARLQFFNRSNMAQKDYDVLELWVREDSQLDLNFIDGATHKVNLLASGQMPASGELKIRFENVGYLPETVKIFAGETEIKILEASLPSQFFKKGSRLSFGFEIGSGIKSLTVSDFEISGKVVK